MDIASIILGVILLAACTLPFIITTMGRKKKEKLIKNQMNDLALSEGTTLGEIDIISQSAFGMSGSGEKFFFVKQAEGKRKQVSISLDKVKHCSLKKEERLINNQNGNYKIIDKLILLFSISNGKDSELALEIYDADSNVQLGDELALVEKWEKKINQRINMLMH